MSAFAPDLARIPAGEFLMGAADAREDERPIHRVHVSEFFIGRFPVTNDEYAKFVRATGHPAPRVRELPVIANGGRDAMFRELSAPYAWEDATPPAGRGGHPAVLIRYDDAVAYCDFLTSVLGRLVRLPTEAEWEKAARGGVDGRKYPWGNEIDASHGNFLPDPDWEPHYTALSVPAADQLRLSIVNQLLADSLTAVPDETHGWFPGNGDKVAIIVDLDPKVFTDPAGSSERQIVFLNFKRIAPSM